MNILTKKAFTMSANGELKPFAFNRVYAVNPTLGARLISDGLAEEYQGEVVVVYPSGEKDITFTANGEYTEDVTVYETADITVALPDGNEEAY